MKDEFEYTTDTGYLLAGIRFTVASEWEGMQKWVDSQGQVLIVTPMHGPGFAAAFERTFGSGRKAVTKLRVIAGSPTLLAEINSAQASTPPPEPVERHALRQIRTAGYNDHPTCVWMQKVAAHALEPQKFPHPGEQPKAS